MVGSSVSGLRYVVICDDAATLVWISYLSLKRESFGPKEGPEWSYCILEQGLHLHTSLLHSLFF